MEKSNDSIRSFFSSMSSKISDIESRMARIENNPPINSDDESKLLAKLADDLLMELDKFYGVFTGKVIIQRGTFEDVAYQYLHRNDINLHYNEDEYDIVLNNLWTYLGNKRDDYLTLLVIAFKAALHGDKLLSCAALKLLNGACCIEIDNKDRY